MIHSADLLRAQGKCRLDAADICQPDLDQSILVTSLKGVLGSLVCIQNRF